MVCDLMGSFVDVCFFAVLECDGHDGWLTNNGEPHEYDSWCVRIRFSVW